MYIDNVILERIDETAQEIVCHSIIDKGDKSPDYNYLRHQLQNLVEIAITEHLDINC
jgi:hypothetical protein